MDMDKVEKGSHTLKMCTKASTVSDRGRIQHEVPLSDLMRRTVTSEDPWVFAAPEVNQAHKSSAQSPPRCAGTTKVSFRVECRVARPVVVASGGRSDTKVWRTLEGCWNEWILGAKERGRWLVVGGVVVVVIAVLMLIVLL